MKKILLLLVVVFGFQVSAQKGQPILPYGYYSIEDVRKLALGDSKKSQEFRKALIPLVQRKLNEAGERMDLSNQHVSWVFDQVIEQEVWLEAGQFKNSRWISDQIDFFVSESRYEGNAGIFVYGNCSFPLYKSSCANLLEASLNKKPTKKLKEQTVLVIDTVYNTVVRQDTVYRQVWIEEPQQMIEAQVEVVYVRQPNYYVEPIFVPFSAPIFFPFRPACCGGDHYQSININNNNYYYENTTNNVVNNHQYPPKEEGGPGGAPTTDTGGPGGSPTEGTGGPGGADTRRSDNPGNASTSGTGGPGGVNTQKSARIGENAVRDERSTNGNTRTTNSSTSGRNLKSATVARSSSSRTPSLRTGSNSVARSSNPSSSMRNYSTGIRQSGTSSIGSRSYSGNYRSSPPSSYSRSSESYRSSSPSYSSGYGGSRSSSPSYSSGYGGGRSSSPSYSSGYGGSRSSGPSSSYGGRR